MKLTEDNFYTNGTTNKLELSVTWDEMQEILKMQEDAEKYQEHMRGYHACGTGEITFYEYQKIVERLKKQYPLVLEYLLVALMKLQEDGKQDYQSLKRVGDCVENFQNILENKPTKVSGQLPRVA